MAPIKTAPVTGAARGIGLAIASRLAADGMRVALFTVGGEARALAADVTRAPDADAAVGQVVAHWGHLDVLVNNAGIHRLEQGRRIEGATAGRDHAAEDEPGPALDRFLDLAM